MLVLNRKKDQSILIGDNIVIKILRNDRRHIKLGIDAPKAIKILRQELLERKANSNFI